MFSLPLHFNSEATADKFFEKPWSIESDKLYSTCAIPKEFGGSGGGLSPEDLYLQSIISCFIGTFKVLAKNSKIDFSKLNVKGQLLVDKDDTNKVVMKSINLKIQLQDADRPDRITTLVEKAIKTGFIINSVKSEIIYELELV
jgi:organic hydroperoxide reductase OsmC/OhrA